jgi:DNA-binding winged helix-turn-helix (wHTH) protein
MKQFAMTPVKVLQSGSFALDLETMRLARDGAPVALGGQPLEIMAILLAEPGRVVTRAALMSALWPNSARIDTGRRLNTAIRALREALGDTADTPQFIETIRGRGYRWIGAQRAPVRAQQQLYLGAMAACLLVVAGPLITSSADGGGRQTAILPEQREILLRAAAELNPSRAISALDALIAQRPGYAAALILRAELAVRQWRGSPNTTLLSRAKALVASARVAVGETADLATFDAELTLGGDWNWIEAERQYRRALTLDPGHAGARKGLAWLLLNAGREEEAFTALEPLLASADMTDALRAELGWFLLRMRREDLALAMCGETASNHINLLSCRHSALARQGAFEAARDVALRLMQVLDAAPAGIAQVRQGSAEAGYQRFLEWRTEHFLRADGQWFQHAQLQAEAGEWSAALASLDRAAAAHEPALVKLWTSAEFAALRTSPQVTALWNAVGPQRS